MLGIVIGIESSFPYSRTFGIFPSKTSTFWSFIVKTLSEMHFKVAYSLVQVSYGMSRRDTMQKWHIFAKIEKFSKQSDEF